MRLRLSGTALAKGLALGRARIRQPHVLEIEQRLLHPDEVEDEVGRLLDAIAATRNELSQLREQLQDALAHEIGEFIDMHALLLDDPDLHIALTDLIRNELHPASYALKLHRDRLVALFDAMDDPYLRSRREDIDQIIRRVQTALQRDKDGSAVIGLSGDVLVTDSVAPAELAQLSERGVVALLVSHGSPLSHSAILARNLGLPMMLLSDEAMASIPDGAAVIVDPDKAEIIVEPEPDDLHDLRTRELEQAQQRRRLSRLRSAPTHTRDGVEITLNANAESREEVARALHLGAAGIGLYRTEFLFLQRREPPDEDEQLSAYRDAVLGMDGRPVTLRTLDLGADKSDVAGITPSGEPNPALGLRGVRLSLARPALFRTQLRAMLRASAYGPVRILIPMLGHRAEMQAVRQLLRQCRQELLREGHQPAADVALGAMIEVPAAALALPSMLALMDFVSIGTNDLVQYLLAADRENDALDDYFTPLHPAVIRVLHGIISDCRRQRTPLSICGEIASDPHYTRLLLALGLSDFSMHPGALLEIKTRIRASHHTKLRRQAQAILRAGDRHALERLMQKL